MASVRCTENKHVHARNGVLIEFGHVDSCMAIICTLADGSRVAAHFSSNTNSGRDTDEHARDFLLTLMNAEISALGASGAVQSILAKGSTRGWTPDLLPQTVMVARARARFAFGDNYADILANQAHILAESVALHQNDFRGFLNRWFQCGANAVTIQNWSDDTQNLTV